MLTIEDGFFPSNNLSAMIMKQVSTTVCVNNYSGKKSGRKSASVVCCLFSDSDEPLCKPPKDARTHHLHPDTPEGELTLTNVTMLFLSSLLSTKVLLGNRLDWVDGMVFNVPVGGLRLRSRTSRWGCGDPCTVLLLMSVVTLASLLSLTPMPAPFHHEYTANADPPSQHWEQQSDRLSSVDILHNGFLQKISLDHHTAVSDVVADKWVDARLQLLLLRARQTITASFVQQEWWWYR